MWITLELRLPLFLTSDFVTVNSRAIMSPYFTLTPKNNWDEGQSFLGAAPTIEYFIKLRQN